MWGLFWVVEEYLFNNVKVSDIFNFPSYLLRRILIDDSDAGHNNYALGDLTGGTGGNQVLEKPTKDLFLTFHCFCTRKDVCCKDVLFIYFLCFVFFLFFFL